MNSMRKRIFLCIIMMMLMTGISGSSYAFEKASNGYAKNAQLISMISVGENGDRLVTNVMINIIMPHSDKWVIVIMQGEDKLVSGAFNLDLSECTIGKESVYVEARGVNDVTGQGIDFTFRCDTTSVEIVLETSKKGEELECPYNLYHVDKDNYRTGILFRDTPLFKDFNDSRWKVGSPGQLKMCIQENPFIKKL